jgi:hypothetical protein
LWLIENLRIFKEISMRAYVYLTIVVCALFSSVLAQADEIESREVETVGQAAIIGNNKVQARDKAIDDALRKAVESSLGTVISAETITENYQLISDRILSRADGYVSKYKILNEKEEDSVYIVKVRAAVAVGAVSSDLDGLKTLIRRKGMPKMIIMVAEQNVGMNNPEFWWGSSGTLTTMDMRVVENTLMEKMREKGFTFVDPETLSGKKKLRFPVAVLTDTQAKRIANVTDAQIILVGQAVAKDIGQTWEGTRLRSAHAEVAVRAINTDTGEIIAVATEQATVPHISPSVAGSQALKKASEKLSEKLVELIGKKWIADTSGSMSVRLVVNGVKNFKMLNKLINILRERVRGVKDVHQQKMKQQTAVLDVVLAGDTRSLATELEAEDFSGVFKLEIVEISANAITVNLIK